jgi:hypothetical protein
MQKLPIISLTVPVRTKVRATKTANSLRQGEEWKQVGQRNAQRIGYAMAMALTN